MVENRSFPPIYNPLIIPSHYWYFLLSVWQKFLLSVWQTFLLSVWPERRNKKEPRTRSAVEQMGFSVSGCGTRGFAAQTVLARDDPEKPHLLPTAPAIVRPANTPPFVGEDLRRGLAINFGAHGSPPIY